MILFKFTFSFSLQIPHHSSNPYGGFWGYYKTNSENTHTHRKTVTPITIVDVVYTFNVSSTFISPKFVTTQKYESLACDAIIEPEPIASIVSSFPHSVSRPSIVSIGATIEAVVIIATVDEP
jgi:hypothetical protein